MKRKYIYLTIVLIVVIVLYILTRGHISAKSHKAHFHSNLENSVDINKINLDKAAFININQNDLQKTSKTAKNIDSDSIFQKIDIDPNEIYAFASLKLTPSNAFLTSLDQNSMKELNVGAAQNSSIFEKSNQNLFEAEIFLESKEINKLFYFNPFNNQTPSRVATFKLDNLSTDPNITSQKKITDIIVANNKYTNSDLLKKRLKTKSGDFINQQKLQKHLNFINLNPFRNVNLVLQPKGRNNYDVELITKDQYPFRFYVGTDDSGINAIGRSRSYTGFNLNRAFFVDSVLSYQFTTSYDTNEFKDHTAQAIFYLPWENVITMSGNFSKFEPDPTMPSLTIDDRFRLDTSFRYDICLPLIKNISQDLILGFDFKRANTNLPYSNIVTPFDPTINVSQAMLSYSINFENKFYQTKFIFEQYFSLGNLLPDQEALKYDQYRRFAQNNYMYSRAYFSNLFKLPNDFFISLMFRGQISNSNLLSSEALAIGGYNSVRGYFENELLADEGLIINAEIRTQNISLIPNKKINDNLQFILFFDYGLASIYETLLFEEKNRSLIGYGPALRYEINPYFIARLDWGIKGVQDPEYGKNDSLLHFSVNFSY
ncbi:MAG TPA: ShlB/FhaC/HecB family hemolysin secretion/activation protein [Chlamydiae bacterium]|nr:ShlB/FhaC/HecB family hemolysin secretion/activation protein [Chlamydiota bacterium]